MRLVQEGDIVIDKGNNYSENATIRVTALCNGKIDGSFNGTVRIAELGTSIYTQNNGFLPKSVVLRNGSGTFVAKSLAGPKNETSKPDPAIITTTNYAVEAPLSLEQWVDQGQKHQLSAGAVFDWFEEHAKDIFDGASGDVATVLSTVDGYGVVATGADFGGATPNVHATKTRIIMNPFLTAMRINSTTGAICNVPTLRYFNLAMLHESRHAYQNFVSTLNVVGVDDDGDSGTPRNDDDIDGLVDFMPIPPIVQMADNQAIRPVCDEIFNDVDTKSYLGDETPDNSDNVAEARDMDSQIWAGPYQ